jgi:hypothetical protein
LSQKLIRRISTALKIQMRNRSNEAHSSRPPSARQSPRLPPVHPSIVTSVAGDRGSYDEGYPSDFATTGSAHEFTPPPRSRIQASQSEGSFTPKGPKNSSKPTHSEFYDRSPGRPRIVIGQQKDQPPPRKPAQKIPRTQSQPFKQFTPEKLTQQRVPIVTEWVYSPGE